MARSTRKITIDPYNEAEEYGMESKIYALITSDVKKWDGAMLKKGLYYSAYEMRQMILLIPIEKRVVTAISVKYRNSNIEIVNARVISIIEGREKIQKRYDCNYLRE